MEVNIQIYYLVHMYSRYVCYIYTIYTFGCFLNTQDASGRQDCGVSDPPMEPHLKDRILSMKYWLFNRDPYNGLL